MTNMKWIFGFFMISSTIFFLILPASSGRAETFDLHLRPYCPAGSNCGHNSWTDYEEYICEAVEELNLEYKKLGFSFRPTIFPNDPFTTVQVFYPGFGFPLLPPDKNQYSEIDVGNACREKNALHPDRLLQTHWRDNVAAANPTAISMMLDETWGTCCSNIARTNKPGGELYGLYCDASPGRTAYGTGTVWAHEMGHHWGLGHTFTYQDPATDPSPDYDGDDDVVVIEGIADQLPVVHDTPDDPESREVCPRYCDGDKNKQQCGNDTECTPYLCLRVCEVGHDEDIYGHTVDGHVWNELFVGPNAADTNSPHPGYCTPVWAHDIGPYVTWELSPTHTHNAMSYYGAACRGPYIEQGIPYYAFSQDQIGRMHLVRSVISVRDPQHLPDMCANYGGDTDNDGICDEEDSCPSIMNLCDQDDSDGDELGDPCDNCRFVNNSDQNDLDGDCAGITLPYNIDPECGDVCDDDLDGDGCYNDFDQHPDQRFVAAGTIPVIPGTCGSGIEYVTNYEDEKGNLDGDVLKNCEDCDDDGDGLCDPGWPPANWQGPSCICTGTDPCPIDSDNELCKIPTGNPLICPPSWFVCAGGNCVEFFLKFTSVINPDPTRDVIFDRFQSIGKTLYAVSGIKEGLTPSQQAMKIGNVAQSFVGTGIMQSMSQEAIGADEFEDRVRLEIWRHATSSAGETLAAVVGEWPTSAIQISDITRGGIIRIMPIDSDTGEGELRISTTWAIGIEEGMELPDTDGDRWPDIADNCVNIANENQFDADSDGFGNMCDPDLDNDGKVTKADLARAYACEGADLSIKVPILEGEEQGGDPDAVMPDRVAAELAAACREADVTGDWLVDSTDTAIVEMHLGDKLDLNPSIQPLPAFTVRCVDPLSFQKTKLDILHLNKSAGRQELHLKGEMDLPYPFTPALDPANNGIRLVIRTAQGETLQDTQVIPDDDWKINADDTHVEFHRKTDNSQMKISLEWGDPEKPGTVKVNIIAKNGDFLVEASELPLFAQLTLNASTAASRQCAETNFKPSPESPSCSLSSKGDKVKCY
ncbi:MAG: hypothetical protein AB1480_06240 [Nitrospirota bacterium]